MRVLPVHIRPRLVSARNVKSACARWFPRSYAVDTARAVYASPIGNSRPRYTRRRPPVDLVSSYLVSSLLYVQYCVIRACARSLIDWRFFFFVFPACIIINFFSLPPDWGRPRVCQSRTRLSRGKRPRRTRCAEIRKRR